ncbi:MAG TPA: hypothetical protein VIX41_01260, partial [Acidimicrobiales bacterium]
LWGTPTGQQDAKSPQAHLANKAKLGAGRVEPTALAVQARMWAQGGLWDLEDHDQLRLWPTPRHSPNENRNRGRSPSHGTTRGTTLAGEAMCWPTPKASEGQRGSDPAHGEGGPSLRQLSGRLLPETGADGTTGSPRADLNPSFVEALMGLPPGWLTPCASGATGSFPGWARRHSPPWRLVLGGDASS